MGLSKSVSKSAPGRRAKLLRADLLQPGDVILSSRFGLGSLIVQATRNGDPARRYSHAALVVNPFTWLESTRHGTGLTYLPRYNIPYEREWVWRRLINLSPYRQIAVFRMPGIDYAKFGPLSPAFNQILGDVSGFQYPALHALADTTAWLEGWPSLKKRLLSSLSPRNIVNPGAFCSQLIVDVFRECRTAGLVAEDVLKHNVPGSSISPNDLADPVLSRLVLLQGMVEVRSDAVPDDLGNEFVVQGNQLRELGVRSQTSAKLTHQLYLDSTAQAAAKVEKIGIPLLVTEGSPAIEDVEGRPELRLIQENALAAGLNPGWYGLQGFASLFEKHVARSEDTMRGILRNLTLATQTFDIIPPDKLASFIRRHTKWVDEAPQVLAGFQQSIENMRSNQAQALRGFGTDGLWIEWIGKTADSYDGSLQSFVAEIGDIEKDWSAIRKRHSVPAVQRVLHRRLTTLRNIAEIAEDTRRSTRSFRHIPCRS
jgi:hypothetical protein